MKESQFAKKNREELKDKAIELYKTGLSCRKVGKEIGRSQQWVWLRVRRLITEDIENLPDGFSRQKRDGEYYYKCACGMIANFDFRNNHTHL